MSLLLFLDTSLLFLFSVLYFWNIYCVDVKLPYDFSKNILTSNCLLFCILEIHFTSFSKNLIFKDICSNIYNILIFLKLICVIWLLMILLELLFHPCIINLITHFISSQMKSTKLQLLVTQYRPLDQQKANGNVRCPFHVRKSIEREGMKRKIIQSRPRPSGPSRWKLLERARGNQKPPWEQELTSHFCFCKQASCYKPPALP